MNQINGKNEDVDFDFFQHVSRSIRSLEKVRQTPEAKTLAEDRNILAERIFEVMDRTEAIEDLIHYEMTLQHLDELSAQSPQDKTSIKNAQKQYRQLSETVAQMRRNPEEYFRANISLGGTDGDFRKMPRGRIQHIHANVTRLRNRASFALEEERNIWDVRLKLAKKTEEMLRALHKALAKEYEQKLTD